MQLPDKSPFIENAVTTSANELKELIEKALSRGSGAFLKIFAKGSDGKYYITILLDRSKVLAAECLHVDTKQTLSGKDAVRIVKSLVDKPMVVDVYDLDELELKLSVADNIDAYSQTPKTSLEDLFGSAVEVKGQQAATASTPIPGETREETKEPQTVARKTQPSPGKPQVIVNLTGGDIPERAFQAYAEALLNESKRIKGLNLSKIEFDANVGEGVVYLNVRVYGTSTGGSRDAEVAEKRILHAISKYAPILLREAEIKPILREVTVVIDGQEIKPQEIVDRDKKKTANVTKDGKIVLSVLEDVWPYFSAFSRTVITEIESSGIKVDRASFDVRGRNEFEINLSVVAETSMDRDEVTRIIRDVVSRHARELSRTIRKYITVHNVDVEVITPATPAKPVTATVGSAKAAEVLAKKAQLEKEVEQLLKQAGIDELSVLTETKKKESQETMLKSRIEPAVETLKNRIHAELKLVPRVTFKWLKLNHDVRGSTVQVDIEASFIRENVGGLFGSFSGVSDEKIKRDITETIQRIIKDVSREYGVSITLRKLNIIIR